MSQTIWEKIGRFAQNCLHGYQYPFMHVIGLDHTQAWYFCWRDRGLKIARSHRLYQSVAALEAVQTRSNSCPMQKHCLFQNTAEVWPAMIRSSTSSTYTEESFHSSHVPVPVCTRLGVSVQKLDQTDNWFQTLLQRSPEPMKCMRDVPGIGRISLRDERLIGEGNPGHRTLSIRTK